MITLFLSMDFFTFFLENFFIHDFCPQGMQTTMERIIETIIGATRDRPRLDRYLAERHTYLSRTAWRREIELGKISINGNTVRHAHRRLNAGDRVRYAGLNFEEPPVDADFAILYEDDDIIAINKTGNLPVHPAGSFFRNTLLIMLEERYGKRFFPAHRLDRETSGVIVYAKTPDAATRLQANLRQARKRYVAIVHGRMAPGRLTLDTPIGLDSESAVRTKRRAYPGAPESACTELRVLRSTERYSVVSATLRTGRLHQIRVHLRHAGYPVVGDKLYAHPDEVFLTFMRSGLTDELLNVLELPRSALHARKLSLIHPRTGRVMVFRAPLPDDMRSFIETRVRHG